MIMKTTRPSHMETKERDWGSKLARRYFGGLWSGHCCSIIHSQQKSSLTLWRCLAWSYSIHINLLSIYTHTYAFAFAFACNVTHLSLVCHQFIHDWTTLFFFSLLINICSWVKLYHIFIWAFSIKKSDKHHIICSINSTV